MKAVALLGHGFSVFLSHGAAQQVGLAERVAGELVGDLHHLFLIDDDAERVFQNSFKLGDKVFDFAAAPFALDEVVDHAHGTGPIEGVERGEFFNRVGLVTAQNIAHAAGLKLEDAGGERGVEELCETFLRHRVEWIRYPLFRHGFAR